MRLVAISDTHALHRHYGREPWGNLPEGDILIHCGDITTHGTVKEAEGFLDWFEVQPHRYKIWIAGNHDRCIEQHSLDFLRVGVIYLFNNGVTIEGVNIWGSPFTPDWQDMSFQLGSNAELIWYKIPDDVDVLITHGPPKGILDKTVSGDRAGCPVLAEVVRNRVKPKYHVFGHIHEAYGAGSYPDKTVYSNCSVHTWLWKPETPRQDPVTFELPTK